MREIQNALDEANGRRRVRTLSLSSVIDVLGRTWNGRNGHWCWEDGGSVVGSYGYPAITTLVFAYRLDDLLYYGITTCPAYCVSPGRAYRVLQPWGNGGEKLRQEKLRAWADDANSLSESEWFETIITAFLDREIGTASLLHYLPCSPEDRFLIERLDPESLPVYLDWLEEQRDPNYYALRRVLECQVLKN